MMFLVYFHRTIAIKVSILLTNSEVVTENDGSRCSTSAALLWLLTRNPLKNHGQDRRTLKIIFTQHFLDMHHCFFHFIQIFFIIHNVSVRFICNFGSRHQKHYGKKIITVLKVSLRKCFLG